MEPAIRPYRPSDRKAAIGLFLELNRHEFTVSGDRRTDIGGAEFCVVEMEEAMLKDSVVVVADNAGTVVGLLVWRPDIDEGYVEERFRRFARVEDVVVSASHRGRGVGRALLDEAERLTRQAGIGRLKLTVLSGNTAAEEAYRRVGFRAYATTMLKELG